MIDELIQEVILLRQQYFPHAKGCSTETFQQFLSILFRDGMEIPRSMADKWMVVLYNEEESVFDRTTKKRRIEKCICCPWITFRSVSRVLVHGLLYCDANAAIDRRFIYHFYLVVFVAFHHVVVLYHPWIHWLLNFRSQSQTFSKTCTSFLTHNWWLLLWIVLFTIFPFRHLFSAKWTML